MYLGTTRRKNKDGTTVEYFQLAHNERDPVTHKPVARIIHSFGRADELDRDQLVRLCRSIAPVCQVEVIDRLNPEESFGNAIGWPDDLTLHQTYSFGPRLVIETLWERLGIGTVLRRICKEHDLRAPHERALLAMVANRLCEPDSQLEMWDRWLPTVYLPSCGDLKLDQMYEAMDVLYEHAAEVEKHVFFETANLFNLKVDLIFYDTTTASFSVDQEDEEDEGIRRFGRSKEGGCGRQVVVALAVTPEGLPVRSWVFPGNTADATTVEQVKADLRGWDLGRAIFVADSAMNSEHNRDTLARACGKYLLASRMASVFEVKNDVLGKRGRYNVIRAGDKINVIPSEAVIEVDGRILPGHFKEDLVKEIRELIGEEPDIDVMREMPATEAPVDDPLMDLITEVLGRHDPTAMTVPCLVTGYTDATHWRKLGMKCYGFSPLNLPQGASFTQLLHGHDERIPIEGFRFGLKVLFEFVTRLVT